MIVAAYLMPRSMVYLQQAVKNGSAKSAIDGLSHSGDHYHEAIDCLQSRYNSPRLIHRAHVCKIMEAPPLKDGSGKELRINSTFVLSSR